VAVASVPDAANRKVAPLRSPHIQKDPAAAASRRCIASAGEDGNRSSFRPAPEGRMPGILFP